MASVIVIESEHGAPWGPYDVLYYRLDRETGEMRRQLDYDTDVQLRYVERVASQLGQDEAIVASCRQQPGGLSAYGSDRVREAMMREGSR